MPTTFVRRGLLIACALFTFATTLQAQTANCTFQPIPLPSNIIRFTPNGIKDYGNVVGTADTNAGTPNRKGALDHSAQRVPGDYRSTML